MCRGAKGPRCVRVPDARFLFPRAPRGEERKRVLQAPTQSLLRPWGVVVFLLSHGGPRSTPQPWPSSTRPPTPSPTRRPPSRRRVRVACCVVGRERELLVGVGAARRWNWAPAAAVCFFSLLAAAGGALPCPRPHHRAEAWSMVRPHARGIVRGKSQSGPRALFFFFSPPTLHRPLFFPPSTPCAVKNFSVGDAGVVAGGAAVSAPVGYLAGEFVFYLRRRAVLPAAQPPCPHHPSPKKKTGLRTRTARPALWVAGLIGAGAGFCVAYQRSAGRLMGFLPPTGAKK